MIEYSKDILGKRFLCKRNYVANNDLFEITIICFSDNRQNLKWKNINGQAFWTECDELTIVDSISDDDVNVNPITPYINKAKRGIDELDDLIDTMLKRKK